jgi:nucleotide-binding universal stress UspA family protein
MGTIIVGVDESPGAADALRWAVREARIRSSELTAVMAWGFLDQHHLVGEKFSPDYGNDAAAKTLHELVLLADPNDADRIDERVVCDLPARALISASVGAEMLVVGARGLGGFRGVLLGSVSQQCAHHATIPVAVIRGVDKTGSANHIVVGIDGSTGARRALDWALDEARRRHATVTVVHAWQSAVTGAMEFAAPVIDDETLRTAAEKAVADALAAANTDGLPRPVETIISKAAAAPAILDAAADASLVVIGTRGLGGFYGLLIGSVSQHVLHHAECPVVVVPPAVPA